MQKIKNIFKKILNKDGFVYKSLSKVYHAISKCKYNIVNNKKVKEERKHYSDVAIESLDIISSFSDSNYIVSYLVRCCCFN